MGFIIGIFLLFAVIFGSVGILVGSSQKKKRACCTQTVDAVVTENVRASSGVRTSNHRHHRTYAPVFEYEFEGRQFRVKSMYSSYPPRFSEGEHTKLMIDPDDPEKIYMSGGAASIITIVFTALGVLFLLIALLILVLTIKSAA